MKNHVWRPLFVVIGIVVVILLARMVIVPDDFGAQERGYMYGFHRPANEEEWKAQEVKYQGSDYCAGCHADKVEARESSPHGIIQCENCHGPALNHPEEPPKLTVDRGRDLCLRCHAALPYPTSGRAVIRGVDPEGHNPGMDCPDCHDPHNPSLEGM